LILISSIGVLEIYENFVGTSEQIASRKNTMHLKFSKIFDYGYTNKFRKSTNQDVFKSSGLSDNDLDLVANRFYWHNIDTLLPQIEKSINELTARQSKMSRLLTSKFSFQFLFSKELLSYTLSLILLVIFGLTNFHNKRIRPFLLSLLLFICIVFTYGWIQRYSYTRLFYSPIIALLVIFLFQTSDNKVSFKILCLLFTLFIINTVHAIQSLQLRMDDAKEISKKVYSANLSGESLVGFGGNVNYEYLFPPVPLRGIPAPTKISITSPITAVTRLSFGSKERFLADSLSLARLDIFMQEHFNKKLKWLIINNEIGIYEVSAYKK